MKIRNGFVSNSSSSSFIVGFSKIPTSPEALEKEMFGSPCEINWIDVDIKPSNFIAQRVFDDIKTGNATRLTKKQALDIILEGSFPGEPPYHFKQDRESDKIEKDYREETGKDVYDDTADPKIKKLYRKVQQKEQDDDSRIRKIAAKAFLAGFWPSLKGKKVFRFEYADDGGEGIFEHGEIFRAFPHCQISKH
jgi:hypothetical protein